MSLKKWVEGSGFPLHFFETSKLFWLCDCAKLFLLSH